MHDNLRCPFSSNAIVVSESNERFRVVLPSYQEGVILSFDKLDLNPSIITDSEESMSVQLLTIVLSRMIYMSCNDGKATFLFWNIQYLADDGRDKYDLNVFVRHKLFDDSSWMIIAGDQTAKVWFPKRLQQCEYDLLSAV